MASDAGIGDRESAYLDVQPADGTTDGTLTVTAPPGGTDQTPAVAAGAVLAGVVRLTSAAITYDAAGLWVLNWTVTGTGAGAEDVEVYVVPSPVAGGPLWRPGRSRVANYIFGRTLARDVETHVYTFDSTTMPTGVQADRLIADAVAWVLSRTGDIDESLFDMASVVAAMRAACSIELAYPAQQQEQSLPRAKELCAQATAAREDLARANEAATGTDPTDPASALLPLWSFPAPVSWGDETFI
jgi:hypothetical protein